MTTIRPPEPRTDAGAPLAAPGGEEIAWSRRHLLDLDDFTVD